MERQRTHSQSFKPMAGMALVGLGIFAAFGNLGWAVLLRNCLCTPAGDALRILPGLVLTACQAVQSCALDHHGLLGWLLQMLVSLWPLLPGVGGAI